MELYSKELQNDELEALKNRYISLEERQEIIDDLRLVKQDNNGISKNRKFFRKCIKLTI